MSTFFARSPEDGPPLGIWVKLPALEIIELASAAQLDFVIIDLEHSSLDIATTAQMISFARAVDVAPIVRIPELDTALCRRLLDAGALGLHVPHVETVEDAAKIVDAVRFAPLGSRGSGVMSRAGGWGRKGRTEYVREGNEDVAIIAAVESASAISHADEILAVDGVDALFIGAGDLSLSLGVAVGSSEIQRLIDSAISAAQRAGKPCGGAMRDAASAVRGIERGYGFMTVGSDAAMLLSTAAGAVDQVHEAVAAR